MSERDVHALQAQALARLAEATQAANDAPDVESALVHLTAATREVLGDKEAHLRPGGLRAGERQFTNAGIFLITPDRHDNLLVAEHGFPPEQHRLRIPIDLGHPGQVVRYQRPLVLANTDESPDFRQILKTARMGSAVFGPMCWRGQMLGQILTAAQARQHLQHSRPRPLHGLCACGRCCLHRPRRTRVAPDPRVIVPDTGFWP